MAETRLGGFRPLWATAQAKTCIMTKYTAGCYHNGTPPMNPHTHTHFSHLPKSETHSWEPTNFLRNSSVTWTCCLSWVELSQDLVLLLPTMVISSKDPRCDRWRLFSRYLKRMYQVLAHGFATSNTRSLTVISVTIGRQPGGCWSESTVQLAPSWSGNSKQTAISPFFFFLCKLCQLVSR